GPPWNRGFETVGPVTFSSDVGGVRERREPASSGEARGEGRGGGCPSDIAVQSVASLVTAPPIGTGELVRRFWSAGWPTVIFTVVRRERRGRPPKPGTRATSLERLPTCPERRSSRLRGRRCRSTTSMSSSDLRGRGGGGSGS